MTSQQKAIRVPLPTIAAMESYLQHKGWVKITPTDPSRANRNAIVYRGGSDADGNPLSVLLPARPGLIDANRCIRDVIRFLAALEAKTSIQLIQTIASQETDVQSVRPKIVLAQNEVRPLTSGAEKRTKRVYGIKPRDTAKAVV